MATTSRLSKAHKAALAQGRDEGRAVRRYLEALDAQRHKRGRRRTPESVQMRLAQIDAHLHMADPLSRVHMIQERINLEAELRSMGSGFDLADLEDAFVACARAYGQRRGVTYAAWREAGVGAAVLRRAGVARSRA